MPAVLLDGKKIAANVQSEIAERVRLFKDQSGTSPVLAAILVGDDPASRVYVRNKQQACKRVGIESQLYRLPAETATAELLRVVHQLNSDQFVSGILVQLPLPSRIDSRAILDAIDCGKDVDAFHPHNVGLISQGRPRFLPCTPHGILQLLKRYDIHVSGRHVVIVGRSDIVGKPLAMMLSGKDLGLGPEMANATVTLCHSQTHDLVSITKSADILIAAIGRSKFITATMVKTDAVVIDVGINRLNNGLVGDVDFESVCQVASHVTPVPGGVGPLTVTMLLENTLVAARIQLDQRRLPS